MRFGAVPAVEAAGVPETATFLDVRESGEWTAGHIAGSIHLPMSELVARVAEVPAVDPLVVVCRVGARSAQVAAWLRHQGWDAVNLDGGLEAWVDAGRPLVTDDGRAGQVA